MDIAGILFLEKKPGVVRFYAQFRWSPYFVNWRSGCLQLRVVDLQVGLQDLISILYTVVCK